MCKNVNISGKRIPPPPRKVIIERLAPIPPKPQSVIIERWLPYTQVKRRVIFNRADPQHEPILVKPRNVIVQWSAPQVQIKREFKYLGVIRANPGDYVNRYRNALKVSRELPSFVKEIPTPQGMTLAAEKPYDPVHELVGDVDALRLVDLDREGLSEYKTYLNVRQPAASSRPNQTVTSNAPVIYANYPMTYCSATQTPLSVSSLLAQAEAQNTSVDFPTQQQRKHIYLYL